MAVMPLVLLPQPVLRQVAQPVDDITNDILQLANNMAETCMLHRESVLLPTKLAC